MKKALLLVIALSFLMVSDVGAIKPTREYLPVVKQETYTTGQTDIFVWEIDQTRGNYDHIVCDGYTISSNTSQKVILAASDTIVTVHVTASQPIISPGGFLWKGDELEGIKITTTVGEVAVTLNGWEEDN